MGAPRKRGYREQLVREGRLWCVDAARSRCEGPIEADHVRGLADNGPDGWTEGRCRKHHREKTLRDARLRGRSRSRSPGWGWVALPLITALGWLLYRPPASPAPALWLVAGALAGGLVVRSGLRWRARRRARLDRLREPLAMATRTPPEKLRLGVRHWSGGRPVEGVCQHAPVLSALGDYAEARVKIERLVERLVGVELVFVWEPSADLFRWSPARGTPASPPPPAGATVPKGFEASAREWAKGEVNIARPGPDEVIVGYPPTVPDHVDTARADLIARAGAKLGDRWRGEWDTAGDRVRLTRRPDLPAKAIPPAGIDDGDVLGIGLAEDGTSVGWDLSLLPHILVVGATRRGKTFTIHRLCRAAAGKAWEVPCCDPKRFELVDLRHIPGITVATTNEDMAATVERAYAVMEDRNLAIEEAVSAGRDRPSFTPYLLVVDEAHELIERLNESYRAEKGSTSRSLEHPALAKWRSIARLGGATRVHLVVGIQRPDADIIKGPFKSNIQAKLAFGPLNKDAAMIVFDRADVGRDLPLSRKGRATAQLGDEIVEVQAWYQPQ